MSAFDVWMTAYCIIQLFASSNVIYVQLNTPSIKHDKTYLKAVGSCTLRARNTESSAITNKVNAGLKIIIKGDFTAKPDFSF